MFVRPPKRARLLPMEQIVVEFVDFLVNAAWQNQAGRYDNRQWEAENLPNENPPDRKIWFPPLKRRIIAPINRGIIFHVVLLEARASSFVFPEPLPRNDKASTNGFSTQFVVPK